MFNTQNAATVAMFNKHNVETVATINRPFAKVQVHPGCIVVNILNIPLSVNICQGPLYHDCSTVMLT